MGTSFLYNRQYTLAKDRYTATEYDNFKSLAMAIRDRLVEKWLATQEEYHNKNTKRVYYLSMEFLIGRLLSNYMINLDLDKITKEALGKLSLNFEELEEQETDAGLGNGGLGRLAACFLDSMATLAIPAHGYGIRYDYGIFKQKIINGNQVEYPDEWLKRDNQWEFARPENCVTIKFYGKSLMSQNNAKLAAKWGDTEDVLAMPYDILIPGYKNDKVNTLRLWAGKSTEDFNFNHFNYGDYERAVYNKVTSENISKVLYPNDDFFRGRELRLKQEYFLTAASISDILRRYKKENKDITQLGDLIAIQLNDTHPALAIAELMRILVDEELVNWEKALEIVRKVFAYTNHTVMPEAIEKWSVDLFGKLLPRHLQIIYEINADFLAEVRKKYPCDEGKAARMSLIEESNPDLVRMAFLCIVCSHKVNGVSELHSELLKSYVFKEFYEMFPEKFTNMTNGITQRRWLLEANPRLCKLITEAIGNKWTTNLYELEKLLPKREDPAFRQRWQIIKRENKVDLSNYIMKHNNIIIDPDSIFDVQVKRIHEYKRQTMLCFFIISQYLKIKRQPDHSFIPRTFIFGGKAAPGYAMAKLTIKFINSMADVINNDKDIKDKIKVVFLEDYRVSLAQKIFPASDLSEQISTAGTEASGTGCMKFMMNGALTIATWDGANIEIAKEVGKENIFIFGKSVEDIEKIRKQGYDIGEFVRCSSGLTEVFNLLRNNHFSLQEFGIFDPLINSILNNDRFYICADFDQYEKAQEAVSTLYTDRENWAKMSITNVAKSGKFSSDRTIKEYAKEIWKVGYEEKIPKDLS
ncbi:MAG: glycogen phosphorylase [Candidatus Firestonebacteria bacterium RIFOXYC2_FULL_39_67]|nr:MAG: glycogen phosphorylase [Candidatus Firestonebacteria bacterium RIFOXYD2_FULL_39_29]OGF56457.1 MAG: glycogen phosphorylase [Candidatus Firestonebacteria bacterium RIFOXYC2_FULL_39_67]